jgi:hypothetical protein
VNGEVGDLLGHDRTERIGRLQLADQLHVALHRQQMSLLRAVLMRRIRELAQRIVADAVRGVGRRRQGHERDGAREQQRARNVP